MNSDKMIPKPVITIAGSLLCALVCLASSLAAAGTVFTDVTASTLGSVVHGASPQTDDILMDTGAAFFDYDRDGDLDLYMTNRIGPNRLWRNDGHRVFVDVAATVGADGGGHDGSGVAAADYDNDGDLDLYLANSDGDVLLKNQLTETRTATFLDVTATAFPGITTPQRGTSASWGDYDKDGYLDLYITNHRALPGTAVGSQDRLFYNNGDGTFTDVSSLLMAGDSNGDGNDDNIGGYGFIASWTDYDNDGDLDIFLINDCPFGPVGTKLFRNDGGTDPLDWRFTEVSENVGAADCRNGMGIAVGDYDRDGWPDYFYTNIYSPLLLHNDGGSFTDVTAAAGLEQDYVPDTGKKRVTWGTIFFDYDLDGFLDLAVAAGTLTVVTNNDPQPNLLYHNDGNGLTFTDVSQGSGFDDPGRGRTVIMGDYDNDGDPDLFLVNYGEPCHLYRNDLANTTGYHWLILDLQGAGPPLSNRDGIGAKIELTTPDGVEQYWETHSGTSLGGGSDLAAYFGLNDNNVASEIQVTWPDGAIQTLTDVAGNQRTKIIEPSGPASITVISPNGREKWLKGTTQTITWTSDLSGNVKIILLNGRARVATIAASTPNTGSYSWTVPTNLADSNKYKVQITSVDNSTAGDRSDRSFTISSSSRKSPRP